MKTIGLGYHDVFETELLDTGVRPQAAHYALTRNSFQEHLQSIAATGRGSSVGVLSGRRSWERDVPILLTFDDGALGSYTCIAEDLERLGWRGHFFIVGDWIGTPGFMNRQQILELHTRGHVIGSHSQTHPRRMAKLSEEALMREWSESCSAISDVIGDKVRVASVPNGYYSRTVGRTAAWAGIEVLFTSEPTMNVGVEDDCLVVGRYAIHGGDEAAKSQALITDSLPRMRQKLLWDVKKTLKFLGGSAYLKVRNLALGRIAPKT